MARSAEILVDACAWAGTGNVLKIQQMLQICSEHAVDFSAKKKEEVVEEEVSEETEEVEAPPTPAPAAAPTPLTGMEIDSDLPSTPAVTASAPAVNGEAPASAAAPQENEEEESKKKEVKQEKELRKQGIAVIGIALVAMGEEVGAEMVLRHFQHLVRLPFVSEVILLSLLCPYFPGGLLSHTSIAILASHVPLPTRLLSNRQPLLTRPLRLGSSHTHPSSPIPR